MTNISIYNVCETHRLGIGCKDHCHIMNECGPCYKAMKITALEVLRNARKIRRMNCKLCDSDRANHCPYCNACDYDNGKCSNIYCEEDLID